MGKKVGSTQGAANVRSYERARKEVKTLTLIFARVICGARSDRQPSRKSGVIRDPGEFTRAPVNRSSATGGGERGGDRDRNLRKDGIK